MKWDDIVTNKKLLDWAAWNKFVRLPVGFIGDVGIDEIALQCDEHGSVVGADTNDSWNKKRQVLIEESRKVFKDRYVELMKEETTRLVGVADELFAKYSILSSFGGCVSSGFGAPATVISIRIETKENNLLSNIRVEETEKKFNLLVRNPRHNGDILRKIVEINSAIKGLVESKSWREISSQQEAIDQLESEIVEESMDDLTAKYRIIKDVQGFLQSIDPAFISYHFSNRNVEFRPGEMLVSF